MMMTLNLGFLLHTCFASEFGSFFPSQPIERVLQARGVTKGTAGILILRNIDIPNFLYLEFYSFLVTNNLFDQLFSHVISIKDVSV